jgi:hypothetical protein
MGGQACALWRSTVQICGENMVQQTIKPPTLPHNHCEHEKMKHSLDLVAVQCSADSVAYVIKHPCFTFSYG